MTEQNSSYSTLGLNNTPILGIDLGTTNSLVAVWFNGQSMLIPNVLGSFLTPSAISIDEDGSILVGQAAKDRVQTHPMHSVASFKRFMGSNRLEQIQDKTFRPEELSALVLKSLKQDAEHYFLQHHELSFQFQEAVITVPAYFSDAQRQATRNAGIIAGFEKIHLLNEPTAAALAYGLHQNQEETQFLVFDFGGGTFDVSILELFEGVMEVKSTAGDNQLGGDDIDNALLKLFVQKTSLPSSAMANPQIKAKLLAMAETAKRALNSKTNFVMQLQYTENAQEPKTYQLDLSLELFKEAIAPILQRLRTPVERAMRDASLRTADLDSIVLAGGSTRMDEVRKLATKMFGRFPEIALNPDEVVARGAAVQAGLIQKDEALSERVMTDVCPYSLGIETASNAQDGSIIRGLMSIVIERNTVIPTSRVETYGPIYEEQKSIRFNVYQGEARKVQDNIILGSFDVPLPNGALGEVVTDVRFTYDVNGLLEVEVTPKKNGMKVAEPKVLVIQSSAERLSEQEIADRLKNLADLKIHPREKMQARALMSRAERIYSQLQGHIRDHLSLLINEYEITLEKQDPSSITKIQKKLEQFLDQIENDSYIN